MEYIERITRPESIYINPGENSINNQTPKVYLH